MQHPQSCGGKVPSGNSGGRLLTISCGHFWVTSSKIETATITASPLIAA